MSIDAGKIRRGLIAVGVFGSGLLLLSISVPRILIYSQIAQIPSSVALSLESGRDIPAPELDEALAYHKGAISIFSHDAVLIQDLGRLELRRVAELKNMRQRSEALKSASSAFETAIAAAPARPFSWSLEAYTQSELSAPAEKVVGLLRMSYFLGPHEASSIMLRSRVGGRMWGVLDEDVRRFTENDFREMWRHSNLRPALVDIYIESTLTTRGAIRRAVLSDKSDQKKFDGLIEQTLGGFKSRL